MLVLIGDIHGNFPFLAAVASKAPAGVPIIQVGDFGYWPEHGPDYVVPSQPVLFIDGNHDHVVDVPNCIWPNAEFVPRGDVRHLDGRNVLFLGGATSVDRAWRPQRHGRHAWFEEEVVTEQDVERALANARGKHIDLMVTHSPPDWMIRKHFSPLGLMRFGHDPRTWRDLSAERVEQVWEQLGKPPLVCGHMHRAVTDDQCRILDIDEVVVL